MSGILNSGGEGREASVNPLAAMIPRAFGALVAFGGTIGRALVAFAGAVGGALAAFINFIGDAMVAWWRSLTTSPDPILAYQVSQELESSAPLIQFRKDMTEVDKELYEWKKAARESLSRFKSNVAQQVVILVFVSTSYISHPTTWEKVLWGYGFDIVVLIFLGSYFLALITTIFSLLTIKRRARRNIQRHSRLIKRVKEEDILLEMIEKDRDDTVKAILKDYEQEVTRFPRSYWADMVLSALMLFLHGVVVTVAGKIKFILALLGRA